MKHFYLSLESSRVRALQMDHTSRVTSRWVYDASNSSDGLPVVQSRKKSHANGLANDDELKV